MSKHTPAQISALKSLLDGSYYQKAWSASSDRMLKRMFDAGLVTWTPNNRSPIVTDAGYAAIAKATGVE